MMLPNSSTPASHGRSGLLALAVLLPWLALLLPVHQINHDVAWFYYVARGIMQGGTLYKDFTDVNAPVAPLSLLPAVWLARAFTVKPDMAVEIWALAAASVSMALSWFVMRTMRLSRAAQVSALAALTIAFVFLPNAGFGQREHFLAILLTPYVLGCVAACAGVKLRPALGCALGVAAAIAVGLKPHFILVPAALEAAVLIRAGLRATWRAQPLALAVGLMVIVAAILWFFPLYLREVVPWAAALYGGYNNPVQLLAYVFYAIYVGAALWICWGSSGSPLSRSARLCLTIAAAAALGAYVAQAKGSVYHILPCSSFLLLLNAGAIAATGVRPGVTQAERGRWILARLLALGFALNIVTAPYNSVDLSNYAAMEKAISAEPGPFVIFSSDVIPGFPIALELDRVWASRENAMIPLPGLLKLEAQGKTSPWEPVFRHWISEDMQRYKPVLVFLAPNGGQSLPPDFDILPWLLRDPTFRAIWAHYHQDGVLDGYRVFRLS
jgi:hypothetical protein